MTIAAMILVSTPGSWTAVYSPLDHALVARLDADRSRLSVSAVRDGRGRAVRHGPAPGRAARRPASRPAPRDPPVRAGLVLNAIETPPPIHWAAFRIPGVLQRIALVYLAVTWMTERCRSAHRCASSSRRLPAIGRR
jgi:hypothetical protein